MELEKLNLTWRGITSLCSKIVKKLKDKYPNIVDFEIIGLSRGGLIPAVIISNMLNVRKVYSIGLKSYTGEEKDHFELYQIPEVSKMDKILLIDDISDSGESFKNTKEMLVGKTVVTASLTLKHKTAFKPDVYGKAVKDDVWVVFPWE
jgi:hypoxanthine phosphoribosyltransferase